MHARIPTFKIDRSRIEDAIRHFNERTLPQATRVSGFKGATLLVDREEGTFRIIGYWEDRGAVEASEATAKSIREDIIDRLNAQLVSLEYWEVAVDYYPEAMREAAGAGAARAW